MCSPVSCRSPCSRHIECCGVIRTARKDLRYLALVCRALSLSGSWSLFSCDDWILLSLTDLPRAERSLPCKSKEVLLVSPEYGLVLLDVDTGHEIVQMDDDILRTVANDHDEAPSLLLDLRQHDFTMPQRVWCTWFPLRMRAGMRESLRKYQIQERSKM